MPTYLSPRPDTKVCRVCRLAKPVDQLMWRTRGGVRTPQTLCRECDRERVRHWRAANRERSRDAVRRWRLEQHGLTPEQYDSIELAQGGVCAICGEPPAERGATHYGYRLRVDHDHATGRVRGLLCNRCNLQLGWYERMQGAIDAYLA